MGKKRYKDSLCRPVVTADGTRIAGGAARNYLLGQFENGVDDYVAIGIRAAFEASMERAASAATMQAIRNASGWSKRLNDTAKAE